jgi:trehalose/maltose hydrolase-like predicted phosphorylase
MKRDRETRAKEREGEEKIPGLTANEPSIDESLIAWHRNADIAYKLPRYRA